MGINKQDWLNAGRWMRDHFSNWFANSFVMMGVFAVIIVAIIIGMYFDGNYAARWSPDEESDVVFRTYGWVISLAMVFFTSAGVKAFQEGAKWAGGTFIAVGVYFTILSITQSIGYVTQTAQQNIAAADAFEKVETVNVNRMSELRAIRDQKLKSKDAEIGRIEGSIADIRNDGVAGISAADLQEIGRLNDSIATLRGEANAEIKVVDALILAELQAPTDSGEAPKAAPQRFDGGVEFWSYIFEGDDASDAFKKGATYNYMFFWSIGCPIIGLMLSLYLVITRRTSQMADEAKPDRKLDDEQWDLWTTYLKRRNAQLKTDEEKEQEEEEARKNRGGLNFDHESWWQDQIAKAQESAVGLQGIVNYYFEGMTVPEFEGQLKHKLKTGWITQDQYDDIMDPDRKARRIDERKKERLRRSAFDDGQQANVVGTMDTSKMNGGNENVDDSSAA